MSKVKVLVTQSYLTLCNRMDCSPSGTSVHGIPQARILEIAPISFSILDPEIELLSPAWQVDSLPLSHLGSPNTFHTLIINAFVREYLPALLACASCGAVCCAKQFRQAWLPRREGSVDTLKHQCGHETRTSSLISFLYFYYKVFCMYKRMYLI